MKEKINVNDYAEQITKALGRGILLNTQNDKFNTMVIGWGGLGRVWNTLTFTVFVRQSRYTKTVLDETGEFTISVPLEGPDPEINRICGTLSGHSIDKEKEAGLTLEPSDVIGTPGIKEYPLTIECKVLYSQKQDLSLLPAEIIEKHYPQGVPGTAPLANRDPHTMYIGEIVSAYIIK